MGKRRLFVRVLQPMWTLCNEGVLNIHTTPSAASQPFPLEGRRDYHLEYQTPDYLYLRRVRDILKPTPEDVVFDIGCGLGRVLCVMAQRKVRKCVGVELQPQLCEAARKNAAQLRGRKAPIEIVCADAATADLSEGTIYYMYNTFGPETMTEVLSHIRSTLSANPRNIKIVYYYTLWEEPFQRGEWLEKYHQFTVLSGMTVSFWRNQRPAARAFAAGTH